MGISIRVVIDTSKIDRLAAAAQGLDSDIADLVSQDIQFGAKARAAVRTGAMRDNIERTTSGGRFTVISLVEYSSFVEFGTSRMAAQPFMVPATEAADIDGACKEALRNAGF